MRRNIELVIDLLGATLLVFLPPLIFEEYTYYLYTIASPQFFNFSGNRLWFDVAWFTASGAMSVLIMGRRRWSSLLPSFISAGAFVMSAYVEPLCFQKECYISSTDGLGPVRDFLLFASLGFLASNATLSKQLFSSLAKKPKLSPPYTLLVAALLGYALSFFPMMHIFAGVTSGYPVNYVQWFFAAAPPAFLGALWAATRGPVKIGAWFGFSCGISSVLLGIALALEVPCSACSGYDLSVGSLVTLGIVFSLLGVWIGSRALNTQVLGSSKSSRRIGNLMSLIIVLAVLTLLVTFLVPNYQMSVVNNIGDVSYNSFSPLEVGHSFVYSGGYLAIPRVSTNAVGVTVSFGNTSIASSKSNFLAAGVGDQSPNCCKDGLDLAYRADAVLFSNGTEALLARVWWACDENIACTGYSWQQLLYYGSVQVPKGTLSNFVELEMNWTSSGNVEWFYRVHATNGSVSQWISYSTFVPPSIQNHYFDAGMFYVGEGNHPAGYAYFYQFGISSAYPIESADWNVELQCPKLVMNGSWMCLQSAGFISGVHSYWKVWYTFGESYSGLSFRYMGNYTTNFYYSGSSPRDGTSIW